MASTKRNAHTLGQEKTVELLNFMFMTGSILRCSSLRLSAFKNKIYEFSNISLGKLRLQFYDNCYQ